MVMGQLTNKNVATVCIGIWKGAMSDAEGIQGIHLISIPLK